MPSFVFKGGTVIDPYVGQPQVRDVYVDKGRIVEKLPGSAKGHVIEAAGMVLSPGLIDMHVHLREPGGEESETIATGCQAAAAGGFTTVACMPNTEPTVDNGSTVGFIKEKAEGQAANVLAIGAITRGLAGEKMADLGEMAMAGAVAFSDDGRTVASSGLLRRAMEYIAMLGLPVISHCLDEDLAFGGVMHEGRWSTRLGLQGIPAAAEEIVVARDIALAELTGCRLHIAHVSTAGSLKLVRDAKQRGTKVTCEVTPHHLMLTDAALAAFDSRFKVSPPLREAKDVEALRAGLKDGTIDVIASDHAPHCRQAKDVEIEKAAFGAIGLETTLPVVIDLAGREGIPLETILEKLTLGPAKVLGLSTTGLAAGAPADLVVIDTKAKVKIDSSTFRSRSRNAAFEGMEFSGAPVLTMLGGVITMDRGAVTA